MERSISVTLWNIAHDKYIPDVEIMVFGKRNGEIVSVHFLRYASYKKAMDAVLRLNSRGFKVTGLAKQEVMLLDYLSRD